MRDNRLSWLLQTGLFVGMLFLSSCTVVEDSLNDFDIDVWTDGVILSEVYAVSSSETRVELYIENVAGRPGIDEFFALSRVGLRAYYHDVGTSVLSAEPTDIEFRDILNSDGTAVFDEYPLYQGAFYVLVFTNDLPKAGAFPPEYIFLQMPSPKGKQTIVPAVTQACTSMELYWVHDEKTRETIDFFQFGGACPSAAKTPQYSSHSWNDANGPNLESLRSGANAKGLARKVKLAPNYGFVHEAYSFLGSDWIVSDGSPAYPTDATCITLSPADDDKDGILDCLEEAGQTFFNMPLYEWGARKNVLDIFLEIDYMRCELSNNLFSQPNKEVLTRLKNKFAEYAPGGIPLSVHMDVGALFKEDLGSGFNLGGGNNYLATSEDAKLYDGKISLDQESSNYSVFFTIKDENFKLARKQIFHYMVMATSGERSNLAGVAELEGNDSLITLSRSDSTGDLYNVCSLSALPDVDDVLENEMLQANFSKANQIIIQELKAGKYSEARRAEIRAGIRRSLDQDTNYFHNTQAYTMMHELSHNLGLNHGGSTVDGLNYKPNYFSVMNYLFTTHGIPAGDLTADAAMTAKLAKEAYYVNRDLPNLLTGDCMTNVKDPSNPDLRAYDLPIPLYGAVLASFNLGFSRGDNGSLAESSIDERVGFTRMEEGVPTSIVIDYNCDGMLSTYSLFDVNNDGLDDTVIHDHDDVSAIHSFFADVEMVKRIVALRKFGSGTDTQDPEAPQDTRVVPRQKVFSDRQKIASIEEEILFRFDWKSREERYNLREGVLPMSALDDSYQDALARLIQRNK